MDEYMNLVIDAAEELSMKKETRKALGTNTFLNQNPLASFSPLDGPSY